MTYNEVGNLESVVREMLNSLNAIRIEYEILIIDDGSTDGSGDLADTLATGNSSIKVFHHKKNLGLGGVYRTGFDLAKGRLVTFFPADGQFSPDILKQFYPLVQTCDMVLGYVPKRSDSFFAKFLSFSERIMYKFMFGDLPKFQGIMLFRRSLLMQFDLKSTGRGWAIVLELIIRASRGGCKILSVPTNLRPRMSGTSKVNNLRTILANLKQAFQLLKHI